MKKMPLLIGLVILFALSLAGKAHQLGSGVIHYEVTRRIEADAVKIVRNGDVLQPGSPDAPELPDVMTFTQQLVFAGTAAQEDRQMPGPIIRRFEGGTEINPQTKPAKVEPPFIEKSYLDLTNQKLVQVLEVKQDSVTKRYRAEEVFAKASGWQETGKTRKIAGYNCRKATCAWQGETYTVWYTTELPLTYSPIHALTPPTGTVLLVESSKESYKATKVESKSVTWAEVQPVGKAEIVTKAQLEEIRRKALASFRQKMFDGPDR